MDARLVQAKHQLLAAHDKLKLLYPGLRSVGTPFYICKRPRIATKIVFADGSTKCTAVARLLLEASLGRCLTKGETCDHIDGDPLNDAVSNLQVLSLTDNARKGPGDVTRAAINIGNSIRMRGVPQPHSRGELNGSSKLTDSQVLDIRSRSTPYKRGFDAVLAAEYGVSRRTINDIRRGVIRNEAKYVV